MESNIQSVVKDTKKNETMVECKEMQTYLRLRGLEEDTSENIHVKVIEILAE